MSESDQSAKMEIRAKTVQELASEGKEVPDRYVHKDCDWQVLSDLPLMETPVIDLDLLLNASSSADELEKLRSALATWGCFLVINHGMTREFLDKVRQTTKKFFELPVDEKLIYSRESNDIEGYGNDMVLSEKQKLDWSDRLYLTIYPEDQRQLKFWPRDPQDFKGVLDEYTMKSKHISEVILKAMARSLNLEDNCFLEQYGEQAKLNARFNLYPRCPRPDLVLGTKPHADGTAITILLQDENVEGLQFLKENNHWFRAPFTPEALLINVGDQAEISSNGIFKSPVHRVVTNSEKDRISLAVFYIPESDKWIEPFEKLVNESRSTLYKKVQNYVEIYFKYYQQGRRPIEAAKVEI